MIGFPIGRQSCFWSPSNREGFRIYPISWAMKAPGFAPSSTRAGMSKSIWAACSHGKRRGIRSNETNLKRFHLTQTA